VNSCVEQEEAMLVRRLKWITHAGASDVHKGSRSRHLVNVQVHNTRHDCQVRIMPDSVSRLIKHILYSLLHAILFKDGLELFGRSAVGRKGRTLDSAKRVSDKHTRRRDHGDGCVDGSRCDVWVKSAKVRRRNRWKFVARPNCLKRARAEKREDPSSTVNISEKLI